MACSSSNNNPKPNEDAGASGSGGKSSGTGGKSGGTGGSKSGTGGSSSGTGGSKSGTGGKPADAGTEEDAGSMMGTECTMDSSKKCYSCDVSAAMNDDEFLNRCTSATCSAYDNSKLSKITNGKLPDLP